MLGDGRASASWPPSPSSSHGLAQPRVGQRLQRAERLARDDEQRRRRVEALAGLRRVGRVDVGDEPALQTVLDVGLQRLVGHHRAEVGAADADVDDRPDPLAGDAGPLAGADLLGERVDALEHLVHVGDDVLAVDLERSRRRGRRSAVCSTARSSVTLMCSPREHRVPPLGRARLLGQRDAARPRTSSSTRFFDRSTCRSAASNVRAGRRGPGRSANQARRSGRERRREVRQAVPRSGHAGAWSHLALDGLDELVPRLLELVDALGLEHEHHVVEVDADLARAARGARCPRRLAGDHVAAGPRRGRRTPPASSRASC